MSAKAFTGIGSMNTGSNWTPTGVPARSNNDTVTWTTIPTGGALSCASFTIPAASVNLSLYDLTDVGQFIIDGINATVDSSIFFPSAAKTVSSETFGIDLTGTVGPTSGGLAVADITTGGTGVAAGGTWEVGDLSADNNPYVVAGAISYGPNGSYGGGLAVADITTGGSGADAGGTWDVSNLTDNCPFILNTLAYGVNGNSTGALSPNAVTTAGSGAAAGGTWDVDNLAIGDVVAGVIFGPNSGLTGIANASDPDTTVSTAGGNWIVPVAAGYSANAPGYGVANAIPGTLAASKIRDATYGTLANLSVLVAAGGSFDEAARNVDPGITKVLSNASGGPVSYKIANSTLAGTATLPSAANVATGTGAFGVGGSGSTPSYPTTSTTIAANYERNRA